MFAGKIGWEMFFKGTVWLIERNVSDLQMNSLNF